MSWTGGAIKSGSSSANFGDVLVGGAVPEERNGCVGGRQVPVGAGNAASRLNATVPWILRSALLRLADLGIGLRTLGCRAANAVCDRRRGLMREFGGSRTLARCVAS